MQWPVQARHAFESACASCGAWCRPGSAACGGTPAAQASGARRGRLSPMHRHPQGTRQGRKAGLPRAHPGSAEERYVWSAQCTQHEPAGVRLKSALLRSQGKVKQIVGSTLQDLGEKARRACHDWDGCSLHAPCPSNAGLLEQDHGWSGTQSCSASSTAHSEGTQMECKCRSTGQVLSLKHVNSASAACLACSA